MCDTLSSAWTELNDKASERFRKLELSLKAQQFFFEANEVESWLNEKADILASTDYGRDRDAATKLLTKHKVGKYSVLKFTCKVGMEMCFGNIIFLCKVNKV